MRSCNKMNMKRALVVMMSSAIAFASQASERASEKIKVDPSVLTQVKSLYGLDEAGAIQRLAAEAEAGDVYRRIKGFELAGYAGAWFDAATQRLHVALASSDSEDLVAKLGAVPVHVSQSLRELETLHERIASEAMTALAEKNPITVGVDVAANRVVVKVVPDDAEAVREVLAAYGSAVEVRESTETAVKFTANMRGADGYRNQTFEQAPGGSGYAPCSVGATTENGYYTAGHCGNRDYYDDYYNFHPASTLVLTDGTTLLGAIGHSEYPFKVPPQKNHDIAWVDTVSGHWLLAQINGYSGGTYNVGVFNVPAAWAGTSDVFTNMSVCRYGYGWQVESCGTVGSPTTQIYTVLHGSTVWLRDVVEVNGGCSNDGDSGGTWISAGSNLILGTTIGANPTNTCPTAATYTYFQPISYHVNAYSGSAGSILTQHGAAVPTVTNFQCPDLSQSYGGVYYCTYDHYNSQGYTTSYWTHSGGTATTGSIIVGTCTGGQKVTAKLTVSNPYGTLVKNSSFNCPQ